MDAKARLKEYFLDNPTKKLRVRQIEREVRIALPSAIRYAKELEAAGILKSETIAGIKLYSAARMGEKYTVEKKLHNMRKLHESGLIRHLEDEYSHPVIILFGSYAKGEDIEHSDIDLYLETPTKEIKALEPFEKKLSKHIQVFCHRSIKEIRNKHLINNIINGVILSGYIEVF